MQREPTTIENGSRRVELRERWPSAGPSVGKSAHPTLLARGTQPCGMPYGSRVCSSTLAESVVALFKTEGTQRLAWEGGGLERR